MIDRSIATLSDAIDRHELSPIELIDDALALAHGTGTEYRAFTLICDERARAMAKAAEARMLAGARLGPLDGLPVTVKDLIALKGTLTTNGAGPGWETSGAASSPTVESLERAGAVVIGKTNAHELGMGITNDNPHYGATKNPWCKGRSPGGSSGGSAAALALGIGVGSIGTDTGGSIRIPAAACGVFGLKPSYGRFSTDLVSAISWSLDHVGPLARNAGDLAALYYAMGAAPSGLRARETFAGIRLGVPTGYFGRYLEPGVKAAYQAALTAFEALGARLVDVEVPDYEDAVEAAFVLAKVEALHVHRNRLAAHVESLGQDVRGFLASGGEVMAADYVAALARQRQFREATEALFARADMLATPTLPATPKPLTQWDVAFGPESLPMFSCMIRLTSPFNITGHPALSAPCPILADGLPSGVQLVGPAGAEPLLLRMATRYEQEALEGHHERLTSVGS